MHQAKVSPKFYRGWYKINHKTEIQVNTGAGLSAQGLTGPVHSGLGPNKSKRRIQNEEDKFRFDGRNVKFFTDDQL